MEIFRSPTAPHNIPNLSEYMDSMRKDKASDGFCPFMTPSEHAGASFNSVYELQGDIPKIQEQLFYIGLIHTEILRRERRIGSTAVKKLSAENLTVRFEQEDEVDSARFLAFPHWFLKAEYTKFGVMFGKFWKGEEAQSRDGRDIPPPPYHMLLIRSAVKPLDPNFFNHAPSLLPELEASSDSGEPAFTEPTLELPDEFQALITKEHTSIVEVRDTAGILQEWEIYTKLMKDYERKKLVTSQ